MTKNKLDMAGVYYQKAALEQLRRNFHFIATIRGDSPQYCSVEEYIKKVESGEIQPIK